MKKKLLLLTICSLLLFGCGKQEPTYVETEIITVSVNTTTKSPTELTQDQFAALSWMEVKEMVETYLPNYHNVYGIPEDKVMEEADWLNLKDIMYYQLYGTFLDSYSSTLAAEVDFSDPSKIVGSDGSYLDPNWIYYAPCKEYINGLSSRDFAKYLNGYMAYYGQDMGTNDFQTYADEDLEELRTMILDQVCKSWGSVDIPTVNYLQETYGMSELTLKDYENFANQGQIQEETSDEEIDESESDEESDEADDAEE